MKQAGLHPPTPRPKLCRTVGRLSDGARRAAHIYQGRLGTGDQAQSGIQLLSLDLGAGRRSVRRCPRRRRAATARSSVPASREAAVYVMQRIARCAAAEATCRDGIIVRTGIATITILSIEKTGHRAWESRLEEEFSARQQIGLCDCRLQRLRVKCAQPTEKIPFKNIFHSRFAVRSCDRIMLLNPFELVCTVRAEVIGDGDGEPGSIMAAAASEPSA